MLDVRLTARVLPYAPVALRDGAGTRVRRNGVLERIDLDPSTLLLATYPELPNSVLIMVQDATTGELRRATLSQLKIAAAGAVATVNGKPGPDVVLTGADVGAVVTVNGKPGPNVVLKLSDLTGEAVDPETPGTLYKGTVDITQAPYSADPTGVDDATKAFNDAFADPAVRAVFGIGTFKVLGAINIPHEKALIGVRRLSKFVIPTAFAGTGVCVFEPIENGPMIKEWDFEFDQPDAPYSGLTQYPPAIYARDCPRFVLDKVRISRAWIGIDMKGNSGGASLNEVEGSSFFKFALIDGCLDTVKVNRMHFWPFGCLQYQNHFNSYLRNGNIGLEAGRCDDLKISDSIFFACLKGVYLRGSEVTTPAVYGPFGTIANTNFDASGGLYAELADMTVVGCMFTTGAGAVTGAPSAGTGGPAVYVGAGAQVEMAGCKFFTTVISTSLGAVHVYGDLVVTGCKFENDVNQTLVNVLAAASANLTMTGCHFKNRVAQTYSQGLVKFNQNPGSFVGNTVTGGGTGILVSAIAGSAVVIDCNRCNGFDIVANPKQIGYGNKNVQSFKQRRQSGLVFFSGSQSVRTVATTLFPNSDSGYTPAAVQLTMISTNLGNFGPPWVTLKNSNSFDINCPGSGDRQVMWTAECDIAEST